MPSRASGFLGGKAPKRFGAEALEGGGIKRAEWVSALSI